MDIPEKPKGSSHPATLFVLCMGVVLHQRASLATKTAKVELQQAEIDRRQLKGLRPAHR